MFEPPQPSDDDVRPGLTSPRQGALLSVIAEVGRPISTTELAGLMEQSLGATAHHVRALARNGLIEWAGERRVRGAVQTFYVPSDLGLEALRGPRIEALLTLFGGAAGLIGEGAKATVKLDPRAEEELRKVIDELRPRVARILASADDYDD